jgi:nonsense-mediated mRNA decay protein 3
MTVLSCIICGKTSEHLIDHVCEDCFLKKYLGDVRLPEYIDIEVCIDCGATRIGNRWKKMENREKMVASLAEGSVKSPKVLELAKVNSDIRWEDERNAAVRIKTVLKRGRLHAEKALETRARIKNSICPLCSRQRGNYYEAILQIRGKNAGDLTERILECFGSKNREFFISRTMETPGGVDFYLSDTSVAKQAAHELAMEFGGEYAESAKLYGMKEGKKVYRMTYLVRLPEYRNGDYVVINGKPCKVVKLRKKDITLLDIARGTEFIADRKTLKKATVLGGEELVKNAIVLSETKGEVQVMDPDSYKTITLIKRRGAVISGGNVGVIRVDEELFIA